MRYEWTGTGSLALNGRVVGAGGTDEDRTFTLDECPAAEKLVAKGLAKRIESPPAEPPPKKSVVKSARDFLFPQKPEPKPEPEPKLEVDVGIMKATVEAGADGKFGTDDDTVTIKPKKTDSAKSSKKAKKKGGKK